MLFLLWRVIGSKNFNLNFKLAKLSKLNLGINRHFSRLKLILKLKLKFNFFSFIIEPITPYLKWARGNKYTFYSVYRIQFLLMRPPLIFLILHNFSQINSTCPWDMQHINSLWKMVYKKC